jgi:hypothetical protein
MMNTEKKFSNRLLVIAFITSLLLSPSVFSNPGDPDVSVQSWGVTVASPVNVSNIIKLVIRVAMPDGRVEEHVSTGEAIILDTSVLNDGSYNYEAWAMATTSDGEKYQTGLNRGRFTVSNGESHPRGVATSDDQAFNALNHQQHFAASRPWWYQMLAVSLEFVIPSANAVNLIADSTTPTIEFEDTSTEGSDDDTREWLIRGRDEDFMIIDDSNDFGSSLNPAESNFTEVFKIEALGTYSGHTKIDTAPTTNSIVIEDTGNISFADGRMYLLKATGKLGLGTTTPDTGIHVKGSGKNQLIKLENTAESTWTMGQIDNPISASDRDGDFQINITANGNGGPTGTMLTIKDENGRIGIGTVNPTGQLHIGGTATQDVFAGMGPDLAAGPALNFGYAGSSFGRGAGFFNVRPDALATGVNPSLRYATANITRMIITNAGRVGIGTLAPTSSLHVSGGNIRVTGGSFIDDGTTLDVPDYVFEKQYKLMPLAELKAYIETAKHLPGVKSAKEVAKDGLNISQSQMALLEKVEELTLYTLQQDEQLATQNQRIAKLESMIAQLSQLSQ